MCFCWTFHCFMIQLLDAFNHIIPESDQPCSAWKSSLVICHSLCWKETVNIVLQLVLANSLLKWVMTTHRCSCNTSAWCSGSSAWFCSSSLVPWRIINSARNKRIKDSSQKPAEVFGGQGDFCLEHAALDKLVPVSPSCPAPPNSTLSSSSRCKQEASWQHIQNGSCTFSTLSFRSCLPLIFLFPTGSNMVNEMNLGQEKDISKLLWYMRFSLCQVFRFVSLCQCFLSESHSHSSAQTQEQRLALSLCAGESQGVTAAFVWLLYVSQRKWGDW